MAISNVAHIKGLSAVKLKQLAFLTGVNSTGIKSEVIQRLTNKKVQGHLQWPNKSSFRVLSIDMGIRNLAYCLLDVKGSPSKSPVDNLKEWEDWHHWYGPPLLAKENSGLSREIKPDLCKHVSVDAWDRISVPTKLQGETVKALLQNVPHGLIAGNPKDTNDVVATEEKESFDPATFSTITYDLVTRVLLPMKPTVVLIERQRYRSAGSPTIQEWTVRVNMLESMLYTVFETLRRTHQSWHGSPLPEVMPVSPKHVAKFWTSQLLREDGDKVRNSKEEKKLKIKVAEDWLDRGLVCEGSAATTKAAFLPNESVEQLTRSKSTSRTGKSKTLKRPLISKRDDLADSLLQGLAWIQWEFNRQRLAQVVDFDIDVAALDGNELKPKAAKGKLSLL